MFRAGKTARALAVLLVLAHGVSSCVSLAQIEAECRSNVNASSGPAFEACVQFKVREAEIAWLLLILGIIALGYLISKTTPQGQSFGGGAPPGGAGAAGPAGGG